MPEEKDRQGTGKHPHKDTQEPRPHHEAKEQQQSGRSEQREQEDKSSRHADTSDLKEREYRDEQGNIHHHTRTYQEQHKK
jgi:hypothetical protein